MKPFLKKIVYLVLLCIFFIYGYAVGVYKIFPLPQLLAIKHYIEYSTGSFESQDQVKPPESVEVYDTFLQRLFLKKIQIKGFSGHGGGLSVTGQYLYILTNKGSVQIYNLSNFQRLYSNIPDVPMNLSGLIKSGHPYKNDFRIYWFRVNGVYSENISGNTHALFASHNSYDEENDCITHNISRIDLDFNGGNLSPDTKWNTIFTAIPCINPVPENMAAAVPYPGHISGGIITNFDKQRLLVSVGDYNRHGINGTEEWAMDSSNPYGKTILVDKNTGNWSVFTTGNRNISGFYIDKDSVIWSVENGPEGGDELNILRKDQNYGWPRVSYGVWYEHAFKLPGDQKTGTHPGFEKPILSWVPSVAPRAITKIEGKKFENWEGDLLMGTMRDQSLHRLRIDQNKRVVYDERIHLGHRIRDMATLPDERIALLTDDGYLIILEDGGSILQKMNSDAKERLASLSNFDLFSSIPGEDKTEIFENTSQAIYQRKCATCHNLNPSNQVGPHLQGLFNRKVGEVEDYIYSRSLKEGSRNWDPDLLKSYLANPEEEFPDTRMQKINLSSSEIDSLIHFFQEQAG